MGSAADAGARRRAALVKADSPHLRHVPHGDKQETTSLELFFDLVFVFAVTQLSHLLLHDLSWAGAGQTLFLLLVVWWAWTYTTWMTNWFDPESTPVRILLIGAMLASLVMSIGIPEAFGDRSLLFAGGYVALQVGRTGWACWAFPRGTVQRDTFSRIFAWACASGVLWIVGACLDTPWLTVVWLAALLVDLAAPVALYWLPGRGRGSSAAWEINTGHFAERFQLFIIIALGESIVITGATASGLEIDTATIVALAVAFLGTAALWWLYFDFVVRIATLRFGRSEDPGRLARDAYTYGHFPLVLGIILAAVGDELVIAHPGEPLDGAGAAVLVAGPAVYLVGHVLFRLRIGGSLSRRRLTAALVICLLWLAHRAVDALVLSGAVVAVLVALILWEDRPAARTAARTAAAQLTADDGSDEPDAVAAGPPAPG